MTRPSRTKEARREESRRRRAALKGLGRCYRCGEKTGGTAYCPGCRKTKTQAELDRWAALAAQGRCRCGAKAVKGRKSCRVHLKKDAARMLRLWRKRRRAGQLYDKLMLSGAIITRR